MAKKKKYTPGTGRIAAKLKKMLKEKIEELGLIDTGLMYDSLDVYYEGDTFVLMVTDYFKYLDQGTSRIPSYDIIESVLNSKEFTAYVEDSIAEDQVNIILDELE